MALNPATPGWRSTSVCKHTRSTITLTSSLQIPVENNWHKVLNMQNSRDSLFLQGGNMLTLREANEYTIKMLSVHWVQWIHSGTKPATTSDEKDLNTAIGAVTSHCAKCLNLNGCCFVKDKCPPRPLHPKCHCLLVDIPTISVESACPIEKFTHYVFVPSKVDDKSKLFMLWGYDIMDSAYLQQEFERQAMIAYSTGNYELNKLDKHGQRINIAITIKRKDNGEYVTFQSGWMVYPDGRIVLVTPYGDR